MALMSPSWIFPDLQGFIHAFLRGLVNVANEIVIAKEKSRNHLRRAATFVPGIFLGVTRRLT
jgi:hypothetical protein